MRTFDFPSRFVVVAVPLVLITSSTLALAGTFTWTNSASGGDWGTASNWSSLPTFAADDVLDFSTLNISGQTQTNLGTPRTAGKLIFADTSGTDGFWLVRQSTLTLATSTGKPEIAVTNQGVNFGGMVVGTQGFTKTGAGSVYFTGLSNTHTGGIVVSGGTLGVYNITNSVDTMLGAAPGAFEAANISLASGTTFANRNIGGLGSNLTLVANRGITLTGGGVTTFDVVDSLGTGSGTGTILTINGAITGSGSINHIGSNNSTLVLNGAITTNGGVANANGALYLGGTNTYTGATTINSGLVVVNGSLASGSAVTIQSTGTLAGSGVVSGTVAVKSNGILAPGGVVGKLTTGNTDFESGSIFSWELGSSPATTGRGTNYDAVNTSALSGSGAIFRVVLNSSQNFSETFWDSNRTWADIFTNVAGTTNLSIASIFSSVQYYNASGALASPAVSQGSFTFSGTNLQWTVVPELSSIYAGILLGAGVLRRRRAGRVL